MMVCALKRPHLILLLLFVSTACSHDSPGTGPSPSTAASVAITPDSPSVAKNQSLQLLAVAKDASGNVLPNAHVAWNSSNPSVATVDASGMLRGLTPGSTTVEASAGPAKATTLAVVHYPSADSVSVPAADSSVVRVGLGTSLMIPAGALPPGTRVTVRELEPLPDSTSDVPLGPSIEIRITPPTGSARSNATPAAAIGLGGAKRFVLRYTAKATRPLSEIKDHLHVIVSDGADAAKYIVVKELNAIEKVGEFGDRAIEITTEVYSNSLTSIFSYTYDATEFSCNASAWDLSRPLNPGTPDPDKIPLVLIHGWQPSMFKCSQAYNYHPDQEVWAALLGKLDATLLSRYEVWVYRYPTYYPVSESARQFALLRPLLHSTRPFVMVAHSMGGLVAAKYMTDNADDGVAGLITLGTPFGGSPLAQPVFASLTDAQWDAFGVCVGPGAVLVPLKNALLTTAGAGDLDPDGALVGSLQQASSRFRDRLDSFAGSTAGLDPGKFSGFDNLVARPGACVLNVLGRSPSDGIVPETSTYFTGARSRRTFTGVTHFSITVNPTVLDAVLQRLRELAATIPGKPARLSIRSGNNQTAVASTLLPAPVVVRVEDSGGVPVPGVSVAFQAASGSGTVIPTAATSDQQGLAETRWTLGNGTGTQTLQASAAGLTAVTFTATATASPPPDTATRNPLTIGGQFQCAVQGNASPTCWGQNRWGQLGDGTTTVRPTPVTSVTGVNLVAVSGGDNFACGLTADGRAFCWGNNSEGELGNGTTTDSPVPVALAPSLRFRVIAASWGHACAIGIDGQTYCWGMDRSGELGAGGLPYSPYSVVKVQTTIKFVGLALGISHTCGLSDAGRAYCWGNFGDGALGIDSAPDTCYYTAGPFPCATSPVAVAGGLSFVQIAAGGQHTCGLTAAGRTYCWGTTPGTYVTENYGLGDGTTRSSRTPIEVASGFQFTSIVAGGTHTCGLTAAGELYCWGRNLHGEIGDGTRDYRLSPVRAAGTRLFARVAAGPGATCGVTSSSAVYCWGYAAFGGWVGDGTDTGNPSPVRVQGLTVQP